jgi:hypothetical protein
MSPDARGFRGSPLFAVLGRDSRLAGACRGWLARAVVRLSRAIRAGLAAVATPRSAASELRWAPLVPSSVVERRPAPRQAVANGAVRGGERHRRALLADARGDTHGVQPWSRRCARGRRPLANVVAVDDEHIGARARDFASDHQAGEACTAHEHVGARPLQRRPVDPATRRADVIARAAPLRRRERPPTARAPRAPRRCRSGFAPRGRARGHRRRARP